MRHLGSFILAMAAAAAAAYVVGVGPLFFGAPLLGALLVLVGAALEIGCWRRHRTARRSA